MTDQDRIAVARFLEGLRGGGTPTSDRIALMLLELPPSPEVLELALECAERERLPGLEALKSTAIHLKGFFDDAPLDQGQTRAARGLAQLLASPLPYPPKVKALTACLEQRDAASQKVVRRYIANEQDPFVLATMASFLGALGDAQDSTTLVTLLMNQDQRVVANALEAICKLRIEVPTHMLSPLIASPDPRVRANALAVLEKADPEAVLALVAKATHSRDLGLRRSIAHLLGQLQDHPKVSELLLAMLKTDPDTGVLKQAAASLKRSTRRRHAAAVVGPLYELKYIASGSRLALVNMLLHEIAIEVGWTEDQVREVGDQYLDARVSKAAASGRSGTGREAARPSSDPGQDASPRTTRSTRRSRPVPGTSSRSPARS
ncbi:MAG: HEAT repeat domain-containing protein [Candidatus Riflebacteria bacterium]|nr:HEAT repeat domain-containing protein [Candidatus Riflebacteria bacterium]